MINKISAAIRRWKTEGQEELVTPKGEKHAFLLSFGKLVVGELSLNPDGLWEFYYSDEFKSQNNIKPISEFPKKDKRYQSEELFAFFVHRIPSISQPEVLATLKKEEIDEHNAVALLARFGRVSISNPFRLTAI
ncbi:MAG: HipA N-terminal domain-containing protein [Bacteroidia bacterium]|nr:HipA N-terminal domain-containing protein [Bacteroidia bacterium]